MCLTRKKICVVKGEVMQKGCFLILIFVTFGYWPIRGSKHAVRRVGGACQLRYRAKTLLANGRVEVEVRRESFGVGVHSLKWVFLKLITSVTQGLNTLRKARWSRTRVKVAFVTDSKVPLR